MLTGTGQAVLALPRLVWSRWNALGLGPVRGRGILLPYGGDDFLVHHHHERVWLSLFLPGTTSQTISACRRAILRIRTPLGGLYSSIRTVL